MKAVFMGTPDFAVPIFEALCGYCDVAAAVTRPDAQSGRGQKVRPSRVKEAALKRGIPVLQPERAGGGEFIESLSAYGADVFAVAAYGLLLPERVLRLPEKYGCVNVHASLLPKLRGAAPIQWAVINGDSTAGVTIMHMDKKLDAGDMILKEEISIEPGDTGGSLHDKLSLLGAGALVSALKLLESGKAARVPQNHDEATYAPMLAKAHGHISWGEPPGRIADLVRGLDPWPAAYCVLHGETLKIWRARAAEGAGIPPLAPGTVAGLTPGGFLVACGGGFVEVLEVQAQGSKRMPAADYLRGHALEAGARLE